MKKRAQFARGLLAGALALCAMMAVRAGAEGVPQVIQVLKVEGNAQYTTDAKNWQTLHKGDVLQPGAVIRTAEKSLVDIIFTDKDSTASTKQVSLPSYPAAGSTGGAGSGGSGAGGNNKPEAASANVVRIFESTVLGVDKIMVDRNGVDETAETELDLRAGQIMGNVKKLSGTSHYEIKVPNGVAGIRGTGYLVSSSGKVYVLDGAVTAVIIAPDGSTIKANIGPGQMFDPSTYDPAHPENPPATPPIPPALYEQLVTQFQTLPTMQRNAEMVVLQDHTIMWLSPVNGTTPR